MADAQESDTPIKIARDDSHLFFSTGDSIAITRLISGQFPNYEAVLPQSNSIVLTLDATTFRGTDWGRAPLMLKTPANPGGTPLEAFDQIRAAVLADRSQFFQELSVPFYGANRPGAKVSQGLRDSFWLQGMWCGLKAAYDCVKAFSETDQTEDLKKFDVPTLILHGDDDQIVPIGASALLSAKLVKGATLRVIPGAPHGLCSTHKDQVNAELLTFMKGATAAAATTV